MIPLYGKTISLPVLIVSIWYCVGGQGVSQGGVIDMWGYRIAVLDLIDRFRINFYTIWVINANTV